MQFSSLITCAKQKQLAEMLLFGGKNVHMVQAVVEAETVFVKLLTA